MSSSSLETVGVFGYGKRVTLPHVYGKTCAQFEDFERESLARIIWIYILTTERKGSFQAMWQRDHRRRDWDDETTDQGKLVATRSRKRQEAFPPELLEGAWPYQHLNFTHLVSIVVRINFCGFKPLSVC